MYHDGLQPFNYDPATCYKTMAYLNRPDGECCEAICEIGGVCEC